MVERWSVEAFERWLERFVKVPGPGGSAVKMVPNPGQRRQLDECPAMRGVPGYYPQPKGRQAGNTTWWLCFKMFLCDTFPGITLIGLTPSEKDVGLEVLAKWRRLLQLAVSEGATAFADPRNDSKDETTFQNGSRVVWHHIGGTESVADSVGRAGTFDFVLATEFGFPHDAELARRAIEALDPALERFGAPIVFDSTPGEPEGTGEPYLEVIRGVRDGVLPGKIFFIGWWEVEHPHHRAPLTVPPTEFVESLMDEERALMRRHAVTLTQIQWRRNKIRKMKGRRAFFKAYPEQLEHLFDRPPEKTLFDPAVLTALREARDLGEWPEPIPLDAFEEELDLRPMRALRPGQGGVLIFEAPSERGALPPSGSPDEARLRWHASRGDRGAKIELATYLRRREGRGRRRAARPRQEEERPKYFAGLDSSDGFEGSDWQTLPILNENAALVCLVRVRAHPLHFAAISQSILTWYGAPARVEDQHGREVATAIRAELTDSHLELAGDMPEGALEILKTRGSTALQVVPTNRAERPRIVGAALSLLERIEVVIHQVILDEMMGLERFRGRVQAKKGKYDDITMALGMAGLCREAWLQRAPETQDTAQARAPRRARSGRRSRYGYFS